MYVEIITLAKVILPYFSSFTTFCKQSASVRFVLNCPLPYGTETVQVTPLRRTLASSP